MKSIVLDTNILFRAVYGKTVLPKIEQYKNQVQFYTPDFCYVELRTHAQMIATKKRVDLQLILEIIGILETIVHPIDAMVYLGNELQAKNRIRDIDDWPILALALTLDCPIWTEDHDFFGTGVVTWVSHNIDIFLKE